MAQVAGSPTAVSSSVGPIAQHWWVPLVRGLIAIVFAIVVFAYPISAIGTFVLIFGAFAFADGVLGIFQALRFAHPSSGRWWLQLLSGVAGIITGFITLVYPAITALVLGFFIAAWAIVTGGLEIGAAFRLRKDVPGEIFMIAAGILSVALGIAMFFIPLAALLAWVWIVATYALISGVLLCMLAFRLRGLGSKAAPASGS